MPLQEVERRTMWVSVWHSDMFGRNDFLGEVRVVFVNKLAHSLAIQIQMYKNKKLKPGNFSQFFKAWIWCKVFLKTNFTLLNTDTSTATSLLEKFRKLIFFKSRVVDPDPS
jgi:hypothetical protein